MNRRDRQGSPPLEAVGKEVLQRELLRQIREDLATLARNQADSLEAATHEENRAEHAKDTRATEQSYLARGLAERVENLRRTEGLIAQLECRAFGVDAAIAVSALVRIAEDPGGHTRDWWLVPAAGGLEIRLDAQVIRTLTPAAPLGRALVGLRTGDESSYETPRGTRDFEVLDVA